MAGTTIIYNGVTIKDVLTEYQNYRVVGNQAGDPLYTEVTIACRGVVWDTDTTPPSEHIGYYTTQGVDKAIESIVGKKLSIPRRRFQIRYGDNAPYLDVRGSGTEVANRRSIDLNNGPLPEARVIQIVGNKSCKVEFKITLAVAMCDGKPEGLGINGEDHNPGLLNLWYTESEHIGADWLIRREYTGRLRVTDRAFGRNPAAFKNVILPPLHLGFKREEITYSVEDDGLSMNFRVVDQEYYQLPPPGCVHMSGGHRVISPKRGGTRWFHEVNITLGGKVGDVSQRWLWRQCLKIIDNKIHYLDKRLEKQIFLESIVFDAPFEKLEVHCSAKFQLIHEVKDNGLVNFKQMITSSFADEITSHDIRDPHHYIPTSLPTFINDLQNSCRPAARPWELGNSGGPVQPLKTGPAKIVRLDRGDFNVNSDDTLFTTSHQKEGLYTRYGITSDYNTYAGIVPAAIGKVGAAGVARMKKIQLHQPTATREVRISAERLGTHPEIPNDDAEFVDSNGVRHTLEWWRFIPGAPQNSADGAKTLHATHLEAKYLLDKPPDTKKAIPIGSVPYRQKTKIDDVTKGALRGPAFILGGGG